MGLFIVLSILPFFPFFLVYWGMYVWKKDKRKALRMAMDVTTFFLVFSVSALFNLTFDSNFGFYLTLILILVALGFIGGAQNRLKGKVDRGRMFRAVWRMSFVIMSFGYVLFTLFGLFRYFMQQM
ncbi:MULTISPECIES: DUF3397 domain-containing protein [Paenibacillus]|uniref:DUF3397 domain-containing protein n=1 Tax=Paenibacillus xylanexedens TaxID=528191 RepID=A0ABS4RKT7_PAEXY|nr:MULTISPECIES: DUF3397 domain-containing protein [Paenibacillus]APO46897.1 hypothetical protein BS614_24545 [Paenibacillus xylanexedens]ETT45044.1 hypothetical protein C170_24130 [Paenibacillus sp. FSL H7-689]MBP2243508.1 hypothetical protein [Paenibacillus xylanexedens]OME98227.1 hypothetical protein BK124_13415 [Paenibacillus amylolyticus]OMF64631.1 hypothetical protein BK141_13180 [Paenibacillus sp. FSL R5-0765]